MYKESDYIKKVGGRYRVLRGDKSTWSGDFKTLEQAQEWLNKCRDYRILIDEMRG